MLNDGNTNTNMNRCFSPSPLTTRDVNSSSSASSRSTPPSTKPGDDLGDQTFFMDDYVKTAMKVSFYRYILIDKLMYCTALSITIHLSCIDYNIINAG